MIDNTDEVWRMMVEGEVYDASHPGLIARLLNTRCKLQKFNNLDADNFEAQHSLLREVLGSCGSNFTILQPFHCDYGTNVRIGDRFFANYNLTILDEARVSIGNDVFIGPNVSIYTACHPTEPNERNKLVEWARPVTIGDNVWIGGSVTILPGVTIGSDTTIGAGSVVTRDIPSGVVAAGNPARVVKHIKAC